MFSGRDDETEIRGGRVTIVNGLPGIQTSHFRDAVVEKTAKLQNTQSHQTCLAENPNEPPDDLITRNLRMAMISAEFWSSTAQKAAEEQGSLLGSTAAAAK